MSDLVFMAVTSAFQINSVLKYAGLGAGLPTGVPGGWGGTRALGRPTPNSCRWPCVRAADRGPDHWLRLPFPLPFRMPMFPLPFRLPLQDAEVPVAVHVAIDDAGIGVAVHVAIADAGIGVAVQIAVEGAGVARCR